MSSVPWHCRSYFKSSSSLFERASLRFVLLGPMFRFLMILNIFDVLWHQYRKIYSTPVENWFLRMQHLAAAGTTISTLVPSERPCGHTKKPYPFANAKVYFTAAWAKEMTDMLLRQLPPCSLQHLHDQTLSHDLILNLSRRYYSGSWPFLKIEIQICAEAQNKGTFPSQ